MSKASETRKGATGARRTARANTKTKEGTTVAQTAPVAPKDAKERRSKEELVVFAFRLAREERDLIHRAAGAAKASRFVRALTVAAARGDEETVQKMVAAVSESGE